MKTILEELFDGYIFPAELIVPQNPEYWALNQKTAGLKETWQKKLSEDEYQALQTLLELHCQSMALEISASFEYGFKLGAMIMMEVLGGRGKLVRGGE